MADPERDPGQNHQQTGRHVCFQDEVEDAALQLEMKDQLRIISYNDNEETELIRYFDSDTLTQLVVISDDRVRDNQ